MYFTSFGLLLALVILLIVCLQGRYRFYQHSKVCKGCIDPKVYFGLSEVERQDENELQQQSESRSRNDGKSNIRSILKKQLAAGRKSF